MKKLVCLLLSFLCVLLCCCGSTTPEVSDSVTPAPETEPQVVEVSDIDGFLAAIAPNTEIHMAPGTYNITEAERYGKMDPQQYYRWNNYGFALDYELFLDGIDNLTVIGEGAKILTEPRSSTVLVFNNCANLCLSGLTVGHTSAAEACEGSVIRMTSCQDVSVDHCSLYGCGTVGLEAIATDSLTVTDTEVHHCSYAGIYADQCMVLQLDRVSVHDCGSSAAYAQAAAAVILNSVSRVELQNMEVYGNVFDALISGSVMKSVTVSGWEVYDNHMANLLDCIGEIRFSDFSLRNNSVDSWFTTFGGNTVSVDGEEWSKEDFSDAWGEQLSSAGIGTVDVSPLIPDITGAKEIHVKTADQFLKAIASDRVIVLDVPRINLTEASDYGEGALEWEETQPEDQGYAWSWCFDGAELVIGNVSNFHIVGGEIVTEPRYANVLNFRNCENVSLEKVILGHTPDQGECSGGVLNFAEVEGVIVDHCDLYGCGILGISARNARNLSVQSTRIHDCSWGAAQLTDSDTVNFLDCTVENCPAPHFMLENCSGFSWEGKLMDPFSNFCVDG